jgi:hypothetical protein
MHCSESDSRIEKSSTFTINSSSSTDKSTGQILQKPLFSVPATYVFVSCFMDVLRLSASCFVPDSCDVS